MRARYPAPGRAEHTRLVLRVLHRLSLIDHLADSPLESVRIHRLVQHAVRDTLTAPEFTRTVQVAADALNAAWPDEDHTDRDLAAVLRANTTTLNGCAGDRFWDRRDGAPSVPFRSGRSLIEAGLNRAAVHHWAEVTSTAEQRLGADHGHGHRTDQPRGLLAPGRTALRRHRRRAARGG